MRPFKFFNNNEIQWISYGGTSHPLSSLHRLYIIRLMRVMRNNGEYPIQIDNRTNQEWYNIFKETKILNLYNQDFDRAGDYSDICDVLGADKNLDSISVLCIAFRQEKSK